MKAREVVVPVVGAMLGGVLGFTGGMHLREEQIETYFDDMEHLDPRYDVFHDDITIDLVPENIDEPSPEVAQRVRAASVVIGDMHPAYETVWHLGSGFLFADRDGQVKLITAGHVADGATLGTIVAHTNENVAVDVEKFDSYFQGQTTQPQGVPEDLAIGTLRNPEAYRDLALPARDLQANPLRHGEQFFLTNFQGGREIGDAVQYTLIYLHEAQEADGQFIYALGDVMSGREEDEVRPGGSGGVVTDSSGEVVGISVALAGEKSCGEDISMGSMDLRVPSTNDECSLSVAQIRRIGNFGTFTTENAGILEVVTNQQAA